MRKYIVAVGIMAVILVASVVVLAGPALPALILFNLWRFH